MEEHRSPVDERVGIAVDALRAGEPVVLLGTPEGHRAAALIMAAERSSAEAIASFVEHTSGLISVAVPEARADELHLPLLAPQEHGLRPYTTSVDLAEGISTGISSHDRSATIRALADPTTRPSDLARPGHVPVLRGSAGGVFAHLRHTEASLDLVSIAGLRPAAVLCALLSPDKEAVLEGDQVERFAGERGYAALSVTDVAEHRLMREQPLTERSRVALGAGPHDESLVTLASSIDDREHLVWMLRPDREADEVPVVAVHVACPAGDVFGSLGCGCGERLGSSLAAIRAAGSGALVYLSADASPDHSTDPTARPLVDDGPAAGPEVALAHGRILLVSMALRAVGLTRVALIGDRDAPPYLLGVTATDP